MLRSMMKLSAVCVLLQACGGGTPPVATVPPVAAPAADAPAALPFALSEQARFNEPWAMCFLPDGRLLVTEKKGVLKLHRLGGDSQSVSGVPDVAYGGQGGLGDVVLHPAFADNHLVYLSYAEAGPDNTFGAAVARAKLVLDDPAQPALAELTVIWRQVPKVSGRGHFGHRIAFAPDGLLYLSSGERQHFDPAQDMSSNLGKIVRLTDAGDPAPGNPFSDQGEIAAQVWSLGHRNPLGLAFDASGRLWELEHGPWGGDEFNLIERGANYGWPVVSNGNHYDGKDIPDHATRPEFNPPEVSWSPVIAPGDFIFYSGAMFADWQGNALAAGMASKALVRIVIDGNTAREAERFAMEQRIREVEQGPDGAIYLLEDGSGARLLKLTPSN